MKLVRFVSSSALAGLALAALSASVGALAAPGNGDPVLINSLPYSINESGSYALAGNLTGDQGIVINASRVTLDLGGFGLVGRETSGDGILVRGNRHDIEIRNGSISGWGGVGIEADTSFNASFHDLRISASALCGLRAGHAAVVENVVAQGNGGVGIQGAEALVVSDCSASANAAWGYELGTGSTIQDCAALQNGGGGIFVTDGALVRDNVVYGNGWQPADGGESACESSTLGGIAVLGAGTRVDNNTVCHNTFGLQLMAAENSVSGNMVSGNSTNYQFEPGNQLELMLCELPMTISWPAKVTLAGTLTGDRAQDGITVDADGVTIDMLDHGLIGVEGSFCAIRVMPGRSAVHIMDGYVRDWGNCGVNAEGAFDCRIVQVSAESNDQDGLRVGPGSSIVDCTAHGNGNDGIKTDQDCTVIGATSNENSGDGVEVGMHSNVSGTTASENVLFGIRADRGSQVAHCTASRNSMGIAVTLGCTVESNTTSFNSLIGIRAEKQCLLLSNLCDQNSTGVFVSSGPGTRVEGNNLSNNQIGLNITAGGNLAIRNSSWADVMAFSIDPLSSFGPIIDLAGGGVVTTENPWANFRN